MKLINSNNRKLYGIFLLLNFALIALIPIPNIGSRPLGIISLVIIIISLLTFTFLRSVNFPQAVLHFVERYSLLLLSGWVAIFLAWCALVLFSDPYRFEFNQGDAVFYSQSLWNIADGMRPENSFFTFNGLPLSQGDDPRYANTYGYVSIFTLHQYWLPLAFLAPLYAIFSKPPMHIFALQICIVILGVFGVYWAVRQAGGTKFFAVTMGICYTLLPQVDTQLYFKGYFDQLALGVMPWLFGALFGRKWPQMYFFALLIALISYPFTYFVVMFGISIAIFFREYIPGLIVGMLGWLVMKFDVAVFFAAVSPYHISLNEIPSYIHAYILERKVGDLVANFRTNIAILLSMLQGMAFLPLLAIRWNGYWDRKLLGIAFLVMSSFLLMLFRSSGWEFPRNALLITPLFMMMILGFLKLNNELVILPSDVRGAIFQDLPAKLLAISMATLIFLGCMHNSIPLASHLPWGESGYFLHDRSHVKEWDAVLVDLDSHVPKEASIAWRAAPEVQAFLTNRQHSWIMGREPKEVKYYVFIGDPPTPKEKPEWDNSVLSLSNNRDFKLVYSENAGKPIVIFENKNAKSVPRDEALLGWNVLLDIFRDKKELLGTALNN